MTMVVREKILLGLLVLLLVGACGRGEEDTSYQKSSPDATTLPAPAPSGTEGVEGTQPVEPPSPGVPLPQTPPVERPRLVVKNGEIALQVDDYSEAQQRVQSITARHGGIVVGSSSHIGSDEELQGFVTVKIPVAQFDAAVSEFRKIGEKLLRENIHAQDISASYYDLEARIANKRKTETRLMEILQSANKVEEIMSVERELSMVREQIEQMEAQKKHMGDQAAMSTLTIHLTGEQTSGFFSKIGDAFSRGVEGFSDALAGVITFLIAGLPIFAVVLLLLWVAFRILRRPQRPMPPQV